MFLKWLTALAWFWSVLAVTAAVTRFIPPVREEDLRSFGVYLLLALPSAAWLVAWYLM